jgi:hypothetical protein
MSLYTALRDAGCKLDNHESDLYVEATADARRILREHGRTAYTFVNQQDGKLWLDVPWWRNTGGITLRW